MDHGDTWRRTLPTRDIVVVLTAGERDQDPIGEAVAQADDTVAQRRSVEDPPRLEVDQAEIDHSQEFVGIGEADPNGYVIRRLAFCRPIRWPTA